ncbi:DNA topoisomerase 2 [Ctenocephalides felis]|uniref:DNA topoisomerase 2 n=1 Tax=Ctenocephalides felis TaxID=7515 RepID=UPI000E6E17C2|nr:DNA topoisomerase 2 [Ctenocephalides felis]
MADIKSMFARMSNGGESSSSSAAPQQPQAASRKSTGKMTIEKTYQKKSQLEHILLRPDTYIGSVEKTTEIMWVYDKSKEMMVQKEITYVPGLYKIFDEILVNAADNKQRDAKMDCIKIEIDQETNTISVWNNGGGIPVVMHKDEQMYVPTMIFGHLLTSSNYNDEEEKVTGGRNGYGAKLCNIFSTKFVVETGSKQYKKHFKQVWGSNMSKASEPKIKDSDSDFTKVTFTPDLNKFKMDKLDDDIVSLMSRRAFDVAASTRGVKVFLNGTKVPIKDFKDYIDFYIRGKEDEMGNPLKVVYENVNPRWEVAMTLSDKGFQQVSFVNSIATTKGGRHVDHVTDSIVKQLLETLKKRNKGGVQIKPFQVKNHMWVFVNCLIVNPTFDSQTKENMTLQAKSFGSKCTLNDKFINQVSKCGIIESVLSWAKFKAQTELAKTSGKKQMKLRGIPKLEDANNAGTKNSLNCTLIITEGDSAKSLAVSGLGVVGRDNYGVFPLRGKMLNVREATHKQILENAEINALIKIIGLQYKKKYTTTEDLKTLRYGKLMIMTDQDQDGSHIKGLVINFIHHNWPELLQLPFLEEFITPIVKVTKKDEEISFYSLPEFEEWKNETPNYQTYNVKYYKGLGTSTSKEAKEYFSNMARHRILFKYDGPSDDHNITMAFAKKCVDLRKEWLTNHMDECKRRKLIGLAERYLYTKGTKEISYSDFVNLELVLYSNADNVRSIPCSMDGMKPGQRKVLFTCLKRNDKREVKVAQLAGSVAEKSAYHHGEMSLQGTIVNLAQNFVGSNNINLLMPNGQFGTRLTGGKDAASARYIFTMLSPLTRLIFHPADDPLLSYEYDDNLRIEPTYYVPILPMVLVNGAEGIGTGWSTKIPNYNPRQIVANLFKMLDGQEPEPMHPWYKNFRGTILPVENRYMVSGEISVLGTDTIEITELPVGTWTQNYKETVLEPLLHGTDKVKPVITDYKEYNTDTTVRFLVTLISGQLAKLEQDNELHKVFKLITTISLANINAFDDNACLRRYDNVLDIMKEFYGVRLRFYAKRKEYLQGKLEAECKKLSNQARFIVEKCDKGLIIENKKRKAMIEELIKRDYEPDPVKAWEKRIKIEEDPDQNAGDDEEEEVEEDVKPGTSSKGAPADPEKAFSKLLDVKNFGYLLGMSMWMLTKEKKDELLKQRDIKLEELEILKNKTPENLWREDLDAFLIKLDEVEEKERNEEMGVTKKQMKAMAANQKAAATGKKKKEILPSEQGRKIEAKVTDELIRRLINADKIKEANAARPKAERAKKEAAAAKEGDEFDQMVDGSKKPLKQRIKKEDKDKDKDKMKQTKLDFSKKGKKNKKKGARKDSFGSESSDEDDPDSDFEAHASSESPKRQLASRGTKKPVKYSLRSSDEEEELFDNKQMDSEPVAAVTVLSDSDSDVKPPSPEPMNADDLFNSLVEDREEEPKSTAADKKPAAKKGRKPKAGGDDDGEAAPKKKRGRKPKSDGSDDDFKKKPTKKKKKNSSDEDFSDEDFQVEVDAKPKSGRQKKTIKYSFDDSDSD